MDGKNIFDFIDNDIMRKLEELEDEEKIREAAFDEEMANFDANEEVCISILLYYVQALDSEEERQIEEVREKRADAIDHHRLHKHRNHPALPTAARVRVVCGCVIVLLFRMNLMHNLEAWEPHQNSPHISRSWVHCPTRLE